MPQAKNETLCCDLKVLYLQNSDSGTYRPVRCLSFGLEGMMRVRAVLMDAVQAPVKGMTGALPPQETTGKVAVRKRPLPPELLVS